jgi:hypothetical protein
MAEASYTTDLKTVSLADAVGTWAEIPSRKGGGSATLEDRAYIQGDYCISQSTGAAAGRTVGLQFDYGGNISGWVSGWVFLIWQFWQAPKAMGLWADGGMRLGVGSGSGDVNLWNTQGNDYGRNPYGGFANVAIDPEYAHDEQIGSPVAGNYRYFWSAPYLLAAVSKGNPHCVDAIRYGRAKLMIRGGNDSSAGRCTFAGIATANDAGPARWGLFQKQFGIYLWKGLMSFGVQNDSSSGSEDAVDFIDSNKVILVDNVCRTYKEFNKIEINDINSIVDWTSIIFISICALSPGQFEMIDNAEVNMDGCSFTSMDTFIFQSNSTILNTIFQGCALITGGGGIFTGSKVLESSVAANASAFSWNAAVDSDGKLDDMTFNRGANAHHALEFGTISPLTMTIRGMVSNGFNASNAQNDSTFHIKRTSGTVTINVIGGTGNFSYKTEGATVVINTGKTLTLTGIQADSEVTIMRAGDDSSAAELHHTETVASSGEVVFSYNTGGVNVDILIMHLDYEPFVLENYTLPAADASLPITQIEDRVYSNP